jgi:hypothetical protein
MKHPAPTGIEAAVCEDIAARQQLGIKKYGTSVAANPLPLLAWLRHAYEEALDMAIYLRRSIAEAQAALPPPSPAPAVAAEPVATEKPPQGRTLGRYTLNGQPMRIQDLADLAGCSWATMQQRLRRRTPEEAVAMGAPGPQGVRQTAAAVQASAAKATRHPYGDQMLTVHELAALAGCSAKVMHLRLRHATPARAVALGTPGPVGRRRRDVDETAAAALPARRPAAPSPASAPAAPPAPALRRKVVLRPPAEKAAPVEVIVPADVKRTVHKRPEPPPVPAHFSSRRPGQYDADASHTVLARVLAAAPKP